MRASDCHGQSRRQGAHRTRKTADGVVPTLRNPTDTVTLAEFKPFIMDGSIPAPGTKGRHLMPAWGQILSTDQYNAILPYIVDGPKAKTPAGATGRVAAAARRRRIGVCHSFQLAESVTS